MCRFAGLIRGRLTRRMIWVTRPNREVRTMPIPTPEQNETKDECIERCMGDETMKEEYPDGDPRLAVCVTRWGERQARGEKVQRPQRDIRLAETGAMEPAGDEQ